MATYKTDPPVLELRVALTTEMYDRMVSFYREGLGLEPSAIQLLFIAIISRATSKIFFKPSSFSALWYP